jgi:hypothetical protein
MVRLSCAFGETSESILGWGLLTWIWGKPTGKACFVGIKSGGDGWVCHTRHLFETVPQDFISPEVCARRLLGVPQ